MTKRLLHRGQTSGGVGDNEATSKNRLQTFHNQALPVLDLYQKQGKVAEVFTHILFSLIHCSPGSFLRRSTQNWHRMMCLAKYAMYLINLPNKSANEYINELNN